MITHTEKIILRANVSDAMFAIAQYFKQKNLKLVKENKQQKYLLFSGRSTNLFSQNLRKINIQVWIFKDRRTSNLEIRFVFEFLKLRSIERYKFLIEEEIKHIKKHISSQTNRDDEFIGALENTEEANDADQIISPWCPNCHKYKGRKKVCPHCNRLMGR